MRKAIGDAVLAFGLVVGIASTAVSAGRLFIDQIFVPVVAEALRAGLVPGLQ